jgi:hypothetical protein
MSSGNAGDFYIQAFQAQAKAQVDWLNALGQYAINAANARRAEAVAAADEAVAEVKLAEARQLELDMARVNSQRYQVQQQLAHVAQHAGDLAGVIAAVDPWRAWNGWKYFLIHSDAAVRTKLSAMTTPPDALTADNWTASCGDAPPGNVIQLAAWLSTNSALPNLGGSAWQLFNQALGVFSDNARVQADLLNAAYDKMAAGFYQTWDPLKLLSLPTDNPPSGNGNAGSSPAPTTPPKTA